MALDENKAVVQRFIDEIVNKGNLDAVAGFCVPGSLLAGALVGQIKVLKTAAPDFHFTIEEMIAEQNKVAVRGTGRGTQTGPLLGLPAFGRLEQPVPPTGKTFMNTAMYMFTLRDGKVVSMVNELDLVGMLQQLGWSIVPPEE